MSWLTSGGVAAALAVGLPVVWGLGWQGLVVLSAFFVSGSLLTQLAEPRPRPGRGKREGPRRTARQVIANGGVAAVAALLGSWTAATGALAAAAADTWATEIGSFSPFPPRLITSGARVTRGTSGGITALGTAGGVAGAVTIGALATWLEPPHPETQPGALLAPVVVAGVLGMLVDSVLGATLQGRYECPGCGALFERRTAVCHEPVRRIRGRPWLDNDAVNLAATLVGAAVAALARFPP